MNVLQRGAPRGVVRAALRVKRKELLTPHHMRVVLTGKPRRIGLPRCPLRRRVRGVTIVAQQRPRDQFTGASGVSTSFRNAMPPGYA